MRYIMILVMVLATLGAVIFYARARRMFAYGSPSGRYRAALMFLGVLAIVVSLNMGFMKSNSRAPYTVYGEPQYKVNSEKPITQEQIKPQTRP
jgi:cytochrome bd-type quinol oxidase subunit 1